MCCRWGSCSVSEHDAMLQLPGHQAAHSLGLCLQAAPTIGCLLHVCTGLLALASPHEVQPQLRSKMLQGSCAANLPCRAAARALPHSKCESLPAMQGQDSTAGPFLHLDAQLKCFKLVACASAGAPRRRSATVIASYPLGAPRHGSTSLCWTGMQQQRRLQRNRECPLVMPSSAP